MDAEETIDKLRSLVHVDIDAAHSYDQILDRVDDESVRAHLSGIGHNHASHADRLIAHIEELGGEPPDRTPDLMGRGIELFTLLSSVVGDDGVLRAFHMGEKIHVKRYQEAAGWDVSGDVKDTIMLFLGDEQSHLKYVEDRLGVRMIGPV